MHYLFLSLIRWGHILSLNPIPLGPDHGGDGSVADAGRTAVSEICGFIDQLLRKVNLELAGESITSTFMEVCLHEFLHQIPPRFPVLHTPAFASRQCIPPLVLNIIALGSLFASHYSPALLGRERGRDALATRPHGGSNFLAEIGSYIRKTPDNEDSLRALAQGLLVNPMASSCFRGAITGFQYLVTHQPLALQSRG